MEIPKLCAHVHITDTHTHAHTHAKNENVDKTFHAEQMIQEDKKRKINNNKPLNDERNWHGLIILLVILMNKKECIFNTLQIINRIHTSYFHIVMLIFNRKNIFVLTFFKCWCIIVKNKNVKK